MTVKHVAGTPIGVIAEACVFEVDDELSLLSPKQLAKNTLQVSSIMRSMRYVLKSDVSFNFSLPLLVEIRQYIIFGNY